MLPCLSHRSCLERLIDLIKKKKEKIEKATCNCRRNPCETPNPAKRRNFVLSTKKIFFILFRDHNDEYYKN